MMKNIFFYIKEAFLSMKKNGIMSLATVVSLTATLMIVSLFLLIYANTNVFISRIESQLIAVAYFSDTFPDKEMGQLQQQIEGLEGVQEVTYISEEDAFNNLKEDLHEHQEILAGIDQNPLPASFEIKVTKTKHLPEIAQQLSQLEAFKEIDYGGKLTEKLTLLFEFAHRAGLVVVLILIFTALLIMGSVIKISIHSRRKEIEIMTLVGATGWFIRWPFIIEGFLKSIFSSILAIGIVGKFYLSYLDRIQASIPFIPLISDNRSLITLAVIILLIGLLIGIFGSLFSLRKISYEELY